MENQTVDENNEDSKGAIGRDGTLGSKKKQDKNLGSKEERDKNLGSEGKRDDNLGREEIEDKTTDKANTFSDIKKLEFISPKWVKRIIDRCKSSLSFLPISKKQEQKDNQPYVTLIYFLSTFIYLELIVHLIIFRSIDAKLIYPILFALPMGLLTTFLTGFFSSKINKTILWFLASITCLLFGLQLVYYDVFKMFFSFQSLGMADDAINEFSAEASKAIWNNIFGLFLVFLPLPTLGWVLRKHKLVERRTLGEQGILFATAFGVHLLAMLALLLFGKGDYTPYDLYYKTKVPELSGKQLGIITLTRFDLGKIVKGEDGLILADMDALSWSVASEPTNFPSPIPEITVVPKPENTDTMPTDANPTPVPSPTPIPIDTSPNILTIDFASLAEQEENETIRTLHNYFDSVTPTAKNEYTGMFQGYNLIMITAEGFSPYAVHEEKTPTLYRLTREGFVFNNFYTALWQTSTSDGEYVAMNGLIPVGTRSMFHSRNNLMPFALGNQFRLLGVDSKAYHNHTYTYYQRNETHPNLGYQFTGVGNGLILESDVWPESDLEMVKNTVDLFAKEEPFHVYYLTVSGHMNYSFVGNSMAYKNKALVEDLPYSSSSKAYIATQIELDRALELLIQKLEEYGVADKTVIALSADHYPYGWDKENIDELAGHEVDPRFEIYRNHFILWNPAMKENIIIEEPCSSLDILPTLSNLFGIPYDSRLLMGQDILSDAMPLVILNNRSFITDKVMYHSETGEVIKLIDEDLPEDYISNLNKVVKNKFAVSQTILKKDYYRYVFPNYPEGFTEIKDTWE